MTISDVAKEIIGGENLLVGGGAMNLKSIYSVSPPQKQNWGMIKEHSTCSGHIDPTVSAKQDFKVVTDQNYCIHFPFFSV